jgi:hypothetical protein
MGWTSNDDFINEVTVNGKYNRADWNKQTGGDAFTAGRWYDLSSCAGSPIANTWSGSALAAQVPTDTTGFGLYHGGNVSTDTKHVINVAAVTAASTGVPTILMLVDMCLYYPGISMATASQQTLTNTTTLTRYTNGVGLRSFLSISTSLGATAHNIDNTAATGTEYTDTANATVQHPGTISCTASAVATHITHSGTAANNFGPFLPLASGGTGIKKYLTFKLSAAPSGAGVASLVICKPLLTVPLTTAGVAGERDLMNQLPSLPQIQDGACLTWLMFAGSATSSSTNFYGSVDLAWG